MENTTITIKKLIDYQGARVWYLAYKSQFFRASTSNGEVFDEHTVWLHTPHLFRHKGDRMMEISAHLRSFREHMMSHHSCRRHRVSRYQGSGTMFRRGSTERSLLLICRWSLVPLITHARQLIYNCSSCLALMSSNQKGASRFSFLSNCNASISNTRTQGHHNNKW